LPIESNGETDRGWLTFLLWHQSEFGLHITAGGNTGAARDGGAVRMLPGNWPRAIGTGVSGQKTDRGKA
jgi:hypothetical protein